MKRTQNPRKSAWLWLIVGLICTAFAISHLLEAKPDYILTGVTFAAAVLAYVFAAHKARLAKEAAAFPFRLVKLNDEPALAEAMADWFSSKWSIPREAYAESMADSLNGDTPVPAWYVALDGNTIVGGLGVIENDFHERRDLTPNVCAVFTEPSYRSRGIAGRLLDFVTEDMASRGIGTLYLVTDHEGFYERYGWEYLGPVTCDSGETSRMYIRRTSSED